MEVSPQRNSIATASVRSQTIALSRAY